MNSLFSLILPTRENVGCIKVCFMQYAGDFGCLSNSEWEDFISAPKKKSLPFNITQSDLKTLIALLIRSCIDNCIICSLEHRVGMLHERKANKINPIWSHVGGIDKINQSKTKQKLYCSDSTGTHTQAKLKHRRKTNMSLWSERLISFRISPLSQSIDSPLGLRPQCLDS